jgi:hypothetical protein
MQIAPKRQSPESPFLHFAGSGLFISNVAERSENAKGSGKDEMIERTSLGTAVPRARPAPYRNDVIALRAPDRAISRGLGQ